MHGCDMLYEYIQIMYLCFSYTRMSRLNTQIASYVYLISMEARCL